VGGDGPSLEGLFQQRAIRIFDGMLHGNRLLILVMTWLFIWESIALPCSLEEKFVFFTWNRVTITLCYEATPIL
jgi:hypothetical protein